MKKRSNEKRFKNSFLASKFPAIILTILAVALVSFLLVYNNYQAEFIIDVDGYMIGEVNFESLKTNKKGFENEEINTVEVHSQEEILKNSFNHYISDKNKTPVNIDYPLYVNDGLTIINYNENVNLLNSDFERTTGYSNLVISYGKLYDSTTYTQIDQESYLFLSYQDGIYINLYDIQVETVANKYYIPTNSFIYFFENQLNYFARIDGKFERKVIEDIDFDSKVTFYYSGSEEKFEYTYEEVITLTGSVYIPKEEPKPIEPEIQDTEEKEEVVERPKPNVKPSTSKPTPKPPQEKPERYWEKPSVTSTAFVSNVYSLEGHITVTDPAGVIVQEPTYTLYINNKISTRRTYYQTSDVVISGLIAETEYVIVGQYTYLAKDYETRIVVTFYVGNVRTKNRDTLEKIDVSFKLGSIYSRKIELNNVKITSSLKSEAIRGVKKVGLRLNDETFILNSKLTQTLLEGESITIQSSDSLDSNTKINFEILFFDKGNNIILATNNAGQTRTCKKEPVLFLKVVENDNINMRIKLDLRNDDNVTLTNYYYSVTSSGSHIKSGPVNSTVIELENLNPNQIFKLRVTADLDLDDGRGIKENVLLAETDLVTLPISSLGLVKLKLSASDITSSGTTIKVEINHSGTDKRLIKLLQNVTLNVYDKNTREKVDTKVISGEDLESLKDSRYVLLNVTGLKSNTEYETEFKTLAIQGTSEYTLDCIYTLRNFKTRKNPAQVLITNMFTTNTMIDYDVKIEDPDGSILTDEVVIELRNKKGELVKTTTVPTNQTEYQRITYNNLESYHNYKITFYAQEYNETELNSTYRSKYSLKKLDILTSDGISGAIELVSSQRKTTGTNVIDIDSELKWYQTQQYYNIPKTVDEEGDLHIYSKNGAANYAYNLSDYNGQLMTVSFKIKAIKAVDSRYGVYITTYLGGTTGSEYGQRINDISTTSWKSVSYTFRVGSYWNSSQSRYEVQTNKTYGENYSNFIGFYINGGTATLAEYEIRDLEAHVIEVEEQFDNESIIIENGTWNTSKQKGNSDIIARTSTLIYLEKGYYYTFNYDCYYGKVYRFDKTGKYTYDTGWKISGQMYYAKEDMQVLVQFAHKEANTNINPKTDVNFRINKQSILGFTVPFEEFRYNLVTKVKVKVVDLRKEIVNDDYYISVYENNEIIKEYNYVELEGKDRIENVIKEIELEEYKSYKVELGVKIRDRYYPLDMFEISTESEVKGISTLNDWGFIQPKGNYILLNDLSLKKYTSKKIGYGYRYFYGVLDFQGYTVSTYGSTPSEGMRIIDRVETTGVLKNLVLDVHFDQEAPTTYSSGFVTYNYGLIENVRVNIYNEMAEEYENMNISPLVSINYTQGKIKNFVVNVDRKIHLFRESSLLVRNNYGLIEDGYIYGKDVVVSGDHSTVTNSRNVALVQCYGGARSKVNRVYTLPSMIYPSSSKAIGGLIAYQTYGEINNVYTTGNSNANIISRGPVVYYIQATATFDKVYYMNDVTYTPTQQEKINAVALNDVYFQENVLGEGFDIEEQLKMGYYPHVKYTSEKMPQQPYINLPEVIDDNLVDIITATVVSQTNTTAQIELTVKNPLGDNITRIGVSDVKTEIVSQKYSDGKSTVIMKIYDPENYVSKYAIRSISSINYLDKGSTRYYDTGEKYVNVSFYKAINTVEDFKKINSGLGQNYAIMSDLDFATESNYYINNFSGKLEGNNHKLKNLSLNKAGKSGLFNQMNGVIQNLNIENYFITPTTTYAGLAGYSNNNGRFINVHMKNVTITLSPEKTSDSFYAGSLVGYAGATKFVDCSATNVTIESNNAISGVTIGGLAGYTEQPNMDNSFAQNVNITVKNSASTNGVGGLIGRTTSENAILTNSYTTGTIKNNNIYTGGLIGLSAGSIDNCYSSMDLTSDLGYIGGLTGYSSSNKTYQNHNLYVGNIYTLKYTKKLIPNLEVANTNFSLDGSLYNGYRSSMTYGESQVTYDDLLNPETYSDLIELGKNYDYSKSSEAILPKLYYSTKNELLPNQKDNSIYVDNLNIYEIAIGNKNANDATIVVYVENPKNYEITGVKIDDTNAKVTKVSTENGKTAIDVSIIPNKYYDNYKLSELLYKETADGDEKKVYKQTRLDLTFYKRIQSYEDWQAISNEYAENYILATHLDFTDKQNVNTNVLINRLETESDSDIRVIKGLTLTNTTNKSGISLIEKVITSIKNISFEDINITDNSTGANNFINVIRYNYGEMTNLNFTRINIKAPKESYVGPIGRNYSDVVNTITAEDITAIGTNYVSGVFAYAENGEMRRYDNITANDLKITGSGNYVAGVFAAMPVHNGNNDYLVNNIYVTNSTIKATGTTSTYVGGIGGISDCSNCEVSDSTITGARYVGGVFGHQRSAYNRHLKATRVNVSASDYYAGGISGYSYYLYDCIVRDSEISLTTDKAYGAGGFSGYRSSYTIRGAGVINTKINGQGGSEVGGLVGRYNSSDIYSSFVQDSEVNGASKVGGLAGTATGTWGWLLLSSVTRTKVNANMSYAGGIIGYLNNAELSQSYLRETEATDMIVTSTRSAGGIYGGLKNPLYYPENVYSLYFEGSVSSETNQAGIATGDQYNADIINQERVVFYENSEVNGQKIKEFAYRQESTENLLRGVTIKQGYYLDNSGNETSDMNYPAAGYSVEYITLKEGQTYKFGLNTKYGSAGSDFFRIHIYSMEDEFVAKMDSGASRYIPRAYYLYSRKEVTFKVFQDCKIRVMFYKYDFIKSYYLHELDYGEQSLNPERLVNLNDLKDPITWTRYLNSNKTYDYYYTSLLRFDYSYFDFTTLNGDMSNIKLTDKSTNQYEATLNTTGISRDGAIFDGKDDNFTIDPAFKISQNLTVTAKINQRSHSSKGYQYLFTTEKFGGTGDGFGIFIDWRAIYIRINGSNIWTGVYIGWNNPTEITVTYDQNRYLKLYLDGDLKYKHDSYRTTIKQQDTTHPAMISPKYTSGQMFNGTVHYLKVYNRALSGDEILSSYNSNVTPTDGLQLYYDFRELDNRSSIGYYPTVYDYGNRITPEGQTKTELPTESNRLYEQLEEPILNTGVPVGSSMQILKKEIKDIYNVYQSGVNTVNLEFDSIYSDVSFQYKNGTYKSEKINQAKKVYTLSYDFKNDLILTINAMNEKKTITLKASDLAKTIKINNDKYYHIKGTTLYENNKKLTTNAYNIFNNLVLLDNNEVYDINTHEKQPIIASKGVINDAIPLSEYTIDDCKVEVFYNFTQITDVNGGVVTRPGQIHMRNENIYFINNLSSTKQNMYIFNTYNTEEYQIALTNNTLISLKEDINYPSYFLNKNIEQIDQDVTSDTSVILVRYKNNYIVAFDYYTGKELFTFGTKEKTSLITYMVDSFTNNYSYSSSNKTFDSSNDLKDTLTNTTDEKIKDLLNEGRKEDITIVAPENKPPTSGKPGTTTEGKKTNNKYVQVYNEKTNTYEVYSTTELLNTEKESVSSTDMKIANDEYLYSYFYGKKKNTFFEKSKVAIYTILISLVIINLIIFIKHTNVKEVKKA